MKRRTALFRIVVTFTPSGKIVKFHTNKCQCKSKNNKILNRISLNTVIIVKVTNKNPDLYE